VEAEALSLMAPNRHAVFRPPRETSPQLDAERLGVAREIYKDRLYSERRREARELGLSVNDVGRDPVDLDLGGLLQSARDVWAA
jgi:hypothetical protein